MDRFESVQPVHIRHADVQVDEVKGMLRHDRNAFRSTGDGGDFISIPLQDARQGLAQAGLIVDDQDVPGGIHHDVPSCVASQTEKFAPPSAWFSARMRP